MAKWGEGDPRWIVEERPDATNVNNWHWTEKNACGWSKDKLKELFIGMKIESDTTKCEITELDKCDGDAVANNRKGKLIFFYEWDLCMNWTGRISDSGELISGKINVPNLSEENDLHEIEVNISVTNNSEAADTLKRFMYEVGRSKIREQLGQYISCLKQEFSQGMILPKKDSNDVLSKTINNLTSGFESKVQMNHVTNKQEKCKENKPDGVKIATTTIELTQNFQCTGEEIYNSLTVPEMVRAFTYNPAKVDARKGGTFELFGGNIHGEFLELTPSTKIIQKWRCKQWPSGHYSIVTIDIIQLDDHTQVKLCQTGVPTIEEQSTRCNWERYYWEALKRTFGFGYFI